MPATSLLSVFPKHTDLLALTPEDLGGAIIEVIPALVAQGRIFNINSLSDQLYPQFGPSYPSDERRNIVLALAEALSLLESQGLVIADPEQRGNSYLLTRRARDLHTRSDVEAFRKGRILPDDLVPEIFAQKVVPLFRRGDYDTAVFQAFKEVEVTVRRAGNMKGGDYPDSDIGVALMRKAFNPEKGPLADMAVVPAEREAVMHLFSGAIGYAKNPTSHRDVAITAAEAARLIIFASHLLNMVEYRAFTAFTRILGER
jgi:hypothetical protein